MSLTSQCFIIVGIVDRDSHRAGADKKVRTKDDKCSKWGPKCNLAATMQRCSNGFPARKGEGTFEMAT